jgi:hypothetical protein
MNSASCKFLMMKIELNLIMWKCWEVERFHIYISIEKPLSVAVIRVMMWEWYSVSLRSIIWGLKCTLYSTAAYTLLYIWYILPTVLVMLIEFHSVYIIVQKVSGSVWLCVKIRLLKAAALTLMMRFMQLCTSITCKILWAVVEALQKRPHSMIRISYHFSYML